MIAADGLLNTTSTTPGPVARPAVPGANLNRRPHRVGGELGLHSSVFALKQQHSQTKKLQDQSGEQGFHRSILLSHLSGTVLGG